HRSAGNIDFSVHRLDDAVGPECEQPQSENRQQDPAERLLLKCLERTAEPAGFAGIVLERRDEQESPDNEESDAARAQSEHADGPDEFPLALRHPEMPFEIS